MRAKIIIDGLKLLVANKESRLRSIVVPGSSVTKADIYRDREGEDLARNVEGHACRVLDAVREYRSAVEELKLMMIDAAAADEAL